MTVPIPHRVTMCMALLGCAAGAGVAAAQAPAPPAPQDERFRLVVEGTSEATRQLDLGGSNGICDSQISVEIDESTTWRRGRGVTVRFTRLGPGRRAPVMMTRVGSAQPLLTVVVAVTRTSSGSAQRTPSGPPEACPPVTEDLSRAPECGRPEQARAVVSLVYAGGVMRVRQVGLGSVTDIRCPVSEVYGGTPELRWSWPTPPALRPESIPPGLIFGKRKAFVVRTDSPRRRSSGSFAAGTLAGRVTDFGRSRVTLRFIRLP